MSHIRSESKHRKADCRKGRHKYGEAQHIGAGIVRRVCRVCAAVTIDLTQADVVSSPVLRSQASILSLVSEGSES